MDNPNTDSIQKVLDLTQKRIDFFHDGENAKDWYQWSETYFTGILEEIKEAAAENIKNNHVYLEDELGDVFWNFCCLLASLEREGKISEKNAIFRRAYNKFSERIGEDGRGGYDWENIKNLQKIARKAEHEEFYGDDLDDNEEYLD